MVWCTKKFNYNLCTVSVERLKYGEDPCQTLTTHEIFLAYQIATALEQDDRVKNSITEIFLAYQIATALEQDDRVVKNSIIEIFLAYQIATALEQDDRVVKNSITF